MSDVTTVSSSERCALRVGQGKEDNSIQIYNAGRRDELLVVSSSVLNEDVVSE